MSVQHHLHTCVFIQTYMYIVVNMDGGWVVSIHYTCRMEITHSFLLVHWKLLSLNQCHPAEAWEWSHSTGFLELVDYLDPNYQITVGGKNESTSGTTQGWWKDPITCQQRHKVNVLIYIYIHNPYSYTTQGNTHGSVTLVFQYNRHLHLLEQFPEFEFFSVTRIHRTSIERRYRALYLEWFLVCSIWK